MTDATPLNFTTISPDLYVSFVDSFIHEFTPHTVVFVQSDTSDSYSHNYSLLSEFPVKLISLDQFFSLSVDCISKSIFSFLYIPDNCFLRPDFLLRSLSHYCSTHKSSDSNPRPYIFSSPFQVYDSNGLTYNIEYSPVVDTDSYQLNHFTYLPFQVFLDSQYLISLNANCLAKLDSEDLMHYFCQLFYTPATTCDYCVSPVPLSYYRCEILSEINNLKMRSRTLYVNTRTKYLAQAPLSSSESSIYSNFLNSLPDINRSIPLTNITAVVCYKDKPEYTYTCISKLRSYNPDISIIAINHNSQPHSLLTQAEALADHVINYSGPYNYSLMNNLGISYSLKNFPENNILLVNNDVYVFENTVNYLASSLNLDDVLVVGSVLFYPQFGSEDELTIGPDSKIQHAGVQIRNIPPTSPHPFFHAFADYKYTDFMCSDFPLQYPTVTAALCLIDRTFFDLYNNFDYLLTPSSHSDTKLFLQLSNSSHKAIVDPRALAIHYESLTRRQKITLDDYESIIV